MPSVLEQRGNGGMLAEVVLSEPAEQVDEAALIF